MSSVLLGGCFNSWKKDIQRGFEQAYFEGQKDAITGDVRIKRNSDSCWIWRKSPWEDDREPIYDPSYKCK